MWREIPEGSVEIQTGLWLYTYTRVISGREYTFRQLYSAQGYCFYDLTIPENYDEEGNLLPENQRVYATYSSCGYTTAEEINAVIISVPYTEGYEVVSVGNGTVTE
jgi:hypothetical protein